MLYAWNWPYPLREDSIFPSKFISFVTGGLWNFSDFQYWPWYYIISWFFSIPYLIIKQWLHISSTTDQIIFLNIGKFVSRIMWWLWLWGIYSITTLLTKKKLYGIVSMIFLLWSGLYLYLSTVTRVDITAFAVAIWAVYFLMHYIESESNISLSLGTLLMIFSISTKEQWLTFFLPIILGWLVYLGIKKKREQVFMVSVIWIISFVCINMIVTSPDWFRERIEHWIWWSGIAGYKKDFSWTRIFSWVWSVKWAWLLGIIPFLWSFIVFFIKKTAKQKIFLYMVMAPVIVHFLFHIYVFNNLVHRHFLPLFFMTSILWARGIGIFIERLLSKRYHMVIGKILWSIVIISLSIPIIISMYLQIQRLSEPRIQRKNYLDKNPVILHNWIVFGDEETCLTKYFTWTYFHYKSKVEKSFKSELDNIIVGNLYDEVILCANLNYIKKNAFGSKYNEMFIFTGKTWWFESDAVNTIVYFKKR